MAGVRYIPSVTIEQQAKKLKYDTEISVNTYSTLLYDDGEFDLAFLRCATFPYMLLSQCPDVT